MDYFYDGQIRRYLLQFIRAFSDINTRTEPDSNGVSIQRRVPVIYGDMSRQVASIIAGNNQNTVIPVPIMAAYVTGMELAPEYRVDTRHVKVSNVVERGTDDNGNYTNKPGNRYTVEAYMPVPYKLKTRLDILTSNTDTKLQILEQILVLFNPSVQLEQNQNPLDWSRIFELELKDVQWSNRTIPVGTDTQYDQASLIFEMIVLINPPAKVKKQKLVGNIITNLTQVPSLDGIVDASDLNSVRDREQIVVTPGNYKLQIENGTARLLSEYGAPTNMTWNKLLNSYGKVEENITMLRITEGSIDEPSLNILAYIQGSDTDTIAFTPIDATVPSGSIPPIDRIIDPAKMSPGNILPAAQIGQRYLVLSSLTSGEEPAIKNSFVWGNALVAYDSDIIEFNGHSWNVVFSAVQQSTTDITYVKNIYDHELYKYANKEWQYGYAGTYEAGYWRVENLCSVQQ